MKNVGLIDLIIKIIIIFNNKNNTIQLVIIIV
jgi:hypothetical protein